MQRVMFDRGQTIFSEGEASLEMYRIRAGAVDILIAGAGGGERRIASLGPDEVFGEMGIIDPAPRSATAVAREPTVCDAYTAAEVIALMSTDPGEVMDLLRALILRLRSSNRKLAAKAPPGPPRAPAGT